MEQTNSEKIEEIRTRVLDRGLHMSRVSKTTKNEFLDLANSEEFMGDYGFTLKWLIDFRKGIMTSPNEEILNRLDLIDEEINNLKKEINELKSKPEQVKTIKTIDGKTIGIGGK